VRRERGRIQHRHIVGIREEGSRGGPQHGLREEGVGALGDARDADESTVRVWPEQLVERGANEGSARLGQVHVSGHEAANAVLLERSDRLVAVWNGEPPSGKGGGTADVVAEAREAGLPVDAVWPEGAARRG
jgi:hypothetical protein